MVVNSKTVAVLHVGEEFLPGLEQELGRMKVVKDFLCELSL